MDSEVEFFLCTDESRCLVSDHCPKLSPFRYGLSNRRSLRDCGQINPGYYDGPLGQQSPRQPEQQGQGPLTQDVREHREHQEHREHREHREHWEQREHRVHREHQEQRESAACQRPPDKAQRKVRRCHSGPPGSFNKPSLLRLAKRVSSGADKPEVPPPVPPRTLKTGDLRRLSGAYLDEDKPPVVPPREPLSRSSFRNPKSLPTYQNGVMPPTQSFAPDPKYVSCQGLQNSEGSPRIRPDIKNNEKVSETHYYLYYC